MQKYDTGKRSDFLKNTDMLYVLRAILLLPQGSIGGMGLYQSMIT